MVISSYRVSGMRLDIEGLAFFIRGTASWLMPGEVHEISSYNQEYSQARQAVEIEYGLNGY